MVGVIVYVDKRDIVWLLKRMGVCFVGLVFLVGLVVDLVDVNEVFVDDWEEEVVFIVVGVIFIIGDIGMEFVWLGNDLDKFIGGEGEDFDFFILVMVGEMVFVVVVVMGEGFVDMVRDFDL